MLRLAIGASLGLVALLCAGQTFNEVHYNVSSGFATGHSVRETPNGYIVFGLQTELDTVQQDCSVSQFALDGTFVDEYYLHRARIEIFGGYADPIGNLPDGSGFVAAQTTSLGPVPVDTVFIVRFTSLGDTLWTKPVLVDTLVYVRRTAAKNSSFYCTGLYSSDNLTGKAFLLITDTLANVHVFHPYTEFEAFALDVDQLGNSYIGGVKYNNNKAYLIKVDTVGNAIWSRTDDKAKGRWHTIKCMFDNKILCLGFWNESSPQPWLPNINTMYLNMYNDNGDMLWEYEGLRSKDSGGSYGTFTDGYQDSDSTFIVAGAIQQLFWNRAVIYRFTADGDSLWRRDYAHFGNLSALYPEIPWDIEPTSDGGMVLTGETWNLDSVPPYSNLNMWILKLDSMGCLVPGCQYVGINEIAYGMEHALKAWPNPSHGQISLALALPDGLPLDGDLHLQVFDGVGRLVVQKNLGKQLSQTIALDLGQQKPGMYSAHISDAHILLTGTKLILK